MSARLTPVRVAERELSRLTQLEEKLVDELMAVRAEKGRWQTVLDAVNGGEHE